MRRLPARVYCTEFDHAVDLPCLERFKVRRTDLDWLPVVGNAPDDYDGALMPATSHDAVTDPCAHGIQRRGQDVVEACHSTTPSSVRSHSTLLGVTLAEQYHLSMRAGSLLGETCLWSSTFFVSGATVHRVCVGCPGQMVRTCPTAAAIGRLIARRT